MTRPVTLVVALATLVLASGCVTKKIKKALEKEARASLTVSGDATTLATIQGGLTAFHDVGATVETLEKGVTIIRIVGAYAEVVDSIVWLIRQNLMLLANDEISRSLLEAAVLALK